MIRLGRRRPAGTRAARGQTLAEFALVIPIVLLALMGIFDLGRAVFAYNTITNAAREATRLGIVNQNATMITDRANAMALTVDAAQSTVTVAVSDPASTPDADDCSPVTIGCNVYVQYQTTFTAITPIIGSIVGDLSLTAESVEPVEFVCGVAGAAITDPALCPKSVP